VGGVLDYWGLDIIGNMISEMFGVSLVPYPKAAPLFFSVGRSGICGT
jgi:hypothetical protein